MGVYLGAEYLDELSLVGHHVSLHHFHAWTEQSLERRHVQHCSSQTAKNDVLDYQILYVLRSNNVLRILYKLYFTSKADSRNRDA